MLCPCTCPTDCSCLSHFEYNALYPLQRLNAGKCTRWKSRRKVIKSISESSSGYYEMITSQLTYTAEVIWKMLTRAGFDTVIGLRSCEHSLEDDTDRAVWLTLTQISYVISHVKNIWNSIIFTYEIGTFSLMKYLVHMWNYSVQNFKYEMLVYETCVSHVKWKIHIWKSISPMILLFQVWNWNIFA